MELEFHAGDSDLDGELRSLYEWLRRADDLRDSSVRLVAEPVRPDAMGVGISHLLVQLWPLEAVVLGTVVMAWIKTRGVDVDVERSQDGGFKIRIRRLRKKDSAEVGEQLLALIRETAADAGAGPAGRTGGGPGGD